MRTAVAPTPALELVAEESVASSVGTARRLAIRPEEASEGIDRHAAITEGSSVAIARLDGRLESERRDPAWAARAEAVAAEAMLAPGLRAFGMPASEQVRCARTMCRMVLTFDKPGVAADWSDFYPLGLASVMAGVRSHAVTLPDGRVELRMYAFRGEAEPRMRGNVPES